jgi:5-methyltetrahydrofolate--homocysteine methyltransferase
MHPTIEKLLAGGTVVLDGAWGTQLQARGLEIGVMPDALNLTKPETVESVARAYAEAGSQIVLTNTFGATSYSLERHGLADKVAEINRAGAECTKRGVGDKALAFGSMGPSGVMLMMGQVKPEEVRAAFTEQAQGLAEGGVDGIVIETMSDPDEACLAVEAAKETGLPVVACTVFDAGKELGHTMFGNTPEEIVERLTAAGVDVIGSNCGQGIDGFIPICKRMRAVTDLPLWMKGNAGLPELVDGKAVYSQTPDEFAESALGLIAAGANFIGGCCGTSPDFIRALVAKVAELKG